MSRTYQKWLLALVLSVAGCDCNDDEQIQDYVQTRAKPGVDFSKFHTFTILDSNSGSTLPDGGIDDEEIPEDVLVNIDTANDQARIELEKIGLTEVATQEEADLVIFSLASVKEDGAYYWECVPGNWWGAWGWVWDSCAWLVPVYVEFTVGSVVVGLADPVAENVPFSGLLQGVADGNGNAEERIRQGVTVMFQAYPEPPSE